MSDYGSQKGRSASVGGGRDSINNDVASQGMSNQHHESEMEVLSQHGISEETFNMIQTKERLEDEAKQRNIKNLERQTFKRELQEHLRVAEALRHLFFDKNIKVIYLNEVIEQLQSRIYGQFIDSAEMKRIIVSICKILPNWCRINCLPKGNFVRIEGKQQIGQIKNMIQEHFEKKQFEN